MISFMIMPRFATIFLVAALVFTMSRVNAIHKYAQFVTIGQKAPGRFLLNSGSTNFSDEDCTVTRETNKDNLKGTGSVVLIFKNLNNRILESRGGTGGVFDLTTGQDVQDGKVNLNLFFTQSKSNKSIEFSTDASSTVLAGSIKVDPAPAFGCQSFIATYSLQISNILKTITRFDSPDAEESRITKIVRGKVVQNSPIGGCGSVNQLFSDDQAL